MVGWLDVGAGLRIAYSNQQKVVKKYGLGQMGGWMKKPFKGLLLVFKNYAIEIIIFKTLV